MARILIRESILTCVCVWGGGGGEGQAGVGGGRRGGGAPASPGNAIGPII